MPHDAALLARLEALERRSRAQDETVDALWAKYAGLPTRKAAVKREFDEGPPPARTVPEDFSELVSPADLEWFATTHPELSDRTLCRFLVARKSDRAAAATMLKATLGWRAENIPILASTCARELERGTFKVSGHDRDGSPVLYYRSCLCAPREWDREEVLRAFIHTLESVFAAHPDKAITVVVDRQGFAMGNLDVELIKKCAAVLSDNYPERMKRVLVWPSGKSAPPAGDRPNSPLRSQKRYHLQRRLGPGAVVSGATHPRQDRPALAARAALRVHRPRAAAGGVAGAVAASGAHDTSGVLHHWVSRYSLVGDGCTTFSASFTRCLS